MPRAFEAPERVQKSLGEEIPVVGGKWRGDLWVPSVSRVCDSGRRKTSLSYRCSLQGWPNSSESQAGGEEGPGARDAATTSV